MNAPGFHLSGEQPIFQAVINQLRFRKFTRDLDPPRLSFLPAAGEGGEGREREGPPRKARCEMAKKENREWNSRKDKRGH